MSDIFVSYARPNERQAHLTAEALRAAGYAVWRDDELPAHRAYAEVIEERIKTAKAVVVLWSADAARSQWVRAEADAAREAGTLVQVSLDGSLPPMPFNQIQCADLNGWSGDTHAAGWQKVVSSIASLAGTATPTARAEPGAVPGRDVVVCVLPFVNMSGDSEQEYFSDGISEDIIIDLSKVLALSLIARNTAFALKGKPVDVDLLARDLGVTHVLEGSVRKAGVRLRITAQLIDCSNSRQLWGDRYDRDMTDIFAIQDEISKAIVSALQLKLLPKEKKAIETRGTANPDAYNLYLKARQYWISGNKGDKRTDDIVIRMCRQATALDPGYARAWALMALAQSEFRFRYAMEDVDAMLAAERALALDPDIAEAYCVKARYRQSEGDYEGANRELETALRLDPESWEVNKEAAHITFRQSRIREAIPYYEKAASVVESDFHATSMLTTCYSSIGDTDNYRRAASLTVTRTEKALAQDPGNGAALAYGSGALAAVGEVERAKEWIARAVLIDPDNLVMRYNLACTLITELNDVDPAIELMGPYFERVNVAELRHCSVDPDMDSVRGDPRFRAMFAAAAERVGWAEGAAMMGGA